MFDARHRDRACESTRSRRGHGRRAASARRDRGRDGECGAARAARRLHARPKRIRDYVLWYYTPMALAFTRPPDAAGRRLRLHGRTLGVPGRAGRAARARSGAAAPRVDVVFTGGQSLYEAKRAPAPEHPCVPEQRRRRALRARAPHRRRSAAIRPASRIRGSASSACIDERMDIELRRRRRGGAAGLAHRA